MKCPAILPVVALLCCSACDSPAPSPGTKALEIPFPGTGETLAPRLTTGADGEVLLSWLQRAEEGATLWASRYRNERWERPVSVVTDAKMFVNWADLPSVTSLGGNRWFAHWLSYSAPRTYAYDVRVSQSFDAGANWTDSVTPHSDGTPTEHGFVSSWQAGDRVGLLWLDGRNMANDPSPENSHLGMALRSALIDANNKVSRNEVVDDLVCDCCQTDVALAGDTPVAVYRDRTHGEIRDIYVGRMVSGQWQADMSIADDGWNIAACPVNGPAVDATTGLLAAAWFTAADESPRVSVTFSLDAGESFTAPLVLASGTVVGHVDIAHVSGERFLVSWVENQGEQFALRLQQVEPGGRLGDVLTVGNSATRFQVPQLAVVDGAALIAWTDEDNGVTTVQTARFSL